MNCKNCNNEIERDKKANIFCSRSCAASFNNKNRDRLIYLKSSIKLKETIKLKKSNKTIKTTLGTIRVPRENRICVYCNSEFIIKQTSKKICCSGSCSRKNSKNTGGYRLGSGRGKSGYYKGIWSDSSYELAWIIYNIDHSIPFERFKGSLTDGKIVYVPDFIQDKHITEIKGIHSDIVDIKNQIAIDNGYTISVLYKEDLKHIFDYVSKTYNLSQEQFHTLYDGHKPKYEYTCDFCDTLFTTENKRKKPTKFCSKQCSLKFNRQYKNN